MPEWHQLVPMSGHAEELETTTNLQLYATSMFHVQSMFHASTIGTLSQMLARGKLIWSLHTKDSGREGRACRVNSCRTERGMNYCVYAHLRQLIAISRHFQVC